jgi:gliding motility-associated-like protein
MEFRKKKLMKHFSMNKVFRIFYDPDKDSPIYGTLVTASLLMFLSINGFSQKRCNNPPTVNLSQTSGSTCFLAPVTVNNNTFGGNATAVTITDNGHGSITPSSVSSSPFSFTYTPDNSDAGNVVTITVTTNNPKGSPCKSATATYQLTVNTALLAPVIDNIIQPTCTVSTGSIILSGLPLYSGWTVTVSPGGMTVQGTGATATIANISPGIYTFTVSISGDCSSSPSSPVEIFEQPITPNPPVAGSITAPTCSVSTGSVNITGLPSQGTWILTRYPGTVTIPGSGTSIEVTNLAPGTYNFSCSNQAGCVSGLTNDVIIPAQPPLPSAPVIGTIIQPTPGIPTGSVTLTGLPSPGTWTILLYPGEIASTGSGTESTISGLLTGTYTFKVKTLSGCTSPESSPVIISAPILPELVITDPAPVCYPATVDLTAPGIKEGSTNGLIYTYWTDESATLAVANPGSVSDGTYYIKGTSSSGLFDIKPVKVTIKQPPVSHAGPDQKLSFQFNTILEADLGNGENGIWSSDSGNVKFNDITDPHSSVTDLSSGKNVLLWIVTNGVCPADTDKVTITIGEIVIPTLITPNGDSKNEYFVIQGLENLGKTELTVFDRRGSRIFRNSDYDNKWNGVDYNEKPLVNDTYFFILKSTSGKSYSGYVVIRK